MNDDADCIRLLTEANRLKYMTIPEGKYSAHCHFAFNGFWCQASHFDHHDDPKEDGYTIAMLPQSDTTKEEAAKLFASILNHLLGGPEHMQYVEFEA